MLEFYKVIGILMAMAALGSAGSALVARERSGQKMGLAFCGLFLAGALACLALARGWF